MIGELLQPTEVLSAGPSIEVLDVTEHHGRPAIRIRLHLDGWDRDRPHGRHENLPPADDYEFLVDSTTGVILRTAARFDGQEFSTVEVIEIEFDGDIPEELFGSFLTRKDPASPE